MTSDNHAPRFCSLDHVLRWHLSSAATLAGKPYDWFSASGLATADSPQGGPSSVTLRSREGRLPAALRKGNKERNRYAAQEIDAWADALRRALGVDGLRVTYAGLRADVCGPKDVALVPLDRGLVEAIVHRNRRAWEGADMITLRVTPAEAQEGVNVLCHRQTGGPRVSARMINAKSLLGDGLPLVRAAVREPLAGLQRLVPDRAPAALILRFAPPESAHASLRAAAVVAARQRAC